ncbi:MAG: hypothetical protein Q8O40_09150 [Chloroflexota bacterium]|nr:hypothetical protein [Chloroflexota bacterium]
MPLKISVSAPGGASLTLEVSERDAYGEMAELAFNRFPQITGAHNGNGVGHPKSESREVTVVEQSRGRTTTPLGSSPEGGDIMPPPSGGGRFESVQASSNASPTDDAFRAFCQQQDPMGDMRRLVVAADGARQHLGMERVSVRELGALFERAGWPQPRNLVQTIRNAARSSFRWLERIPGRVGYYTVSQRGRAAVLK